MLKHTSEQAVTYRTDAARILGVSESTIIRWHDRGIFPNSYRLPHGERAFVVGDLLAHKRRMGQRRRIDYKNPALTSAAAGRETMQLLPPIADFAAMLAASTAAADESLAAVIGKR